MPAWSAIFRTAGVNTPERTTAAEFPRYSIGKVLADGVPPMARAFCAALSVSTRCRSIPRVCDPGAVDVLSSWARRRGLDSQLKIHPESYFTVGP